ncbi:lactonase family protein [Oerskovia flava]|uniref:lactonase family protein n=1 Tax=Oerskovia flava TaxID=2986422 RepID=UPI00223F3A7D|nr:beta-propeller fold lactonase family protein [Oerskovia sp. JB1-3-2]
MSSGTSSTSAPTSTRGLWIGTYPDGGPAGSGEGVWRVDVDSRSGAFTAPRLAAATPAPSFVALHPTGRVLYAVAEVTDGELSAFTVGPGGTLAPLGEPVTTGGSSPCHVVSTETEVWVTNYGNGVFTAVPLDTDGAFDGAAQHRTHEGSGPDHERQDGPHAHSSARVDGEAWVADLGTDELRRYPYPTRPDAPAGLAARLPDGAGPRHFVTLDGDVPGDGPGSAVLLVSELDARVYVLVPAAHVQPGADPGGAPYAVAAHHPACSTVAPDGGRGYPSHIALSADGTRLFVAVRGPDVLSTFAVRPGPVPELTHLGDTPVGGRWPRHFAVVSSGATDARADLVVVANQESSTLTALRVPREGGVGEVVGSCPVPVPACVVED